MNQNIVIATAKSDTIGSRIKKERTAKQMLQKDLAAAVSISRSKMSKIETDKLQVAPYDLPKFAEVLDVSEAYLKGETMAQNTQTSLVSEFETQFTRVTTTDKYVPSAGAYTAEDIKVSLGGKYLVMETSTGIFDLAMSIAVINEEKGLTRQERTGRIEGAKQKFAEKGAKGETKTYLVLTPEQLDEIVTNLIANQGYVSRLLKLLSYPPLDE